MTQYNILYDRGDGTSSLYLACNCDYKTAQIFLMRFKTQYIGHNDDEGKYIPKPYPNGKGHYPFTDPVIVGIRENGEMFLV
jgi:hypothetical protein